MTRIPVRPGPALVHTGVGAVDELPGVLAQDAVRKVLFVHGTKSLRAAEPFLPDWGEVEIVEAEFRGECSPQEIGRLAERTRDAGVDAVIGLGGGKALDTAKAVGQSVSLPIYLVPTLASTCSGWSAVSVYYDDDHRHLGHDNWDTPTRALFVDPRIIFDSPVALFVSGIADTLAKHVETRAAFSHVSPAATLASFGKSAAERCGELARTLSVHAVDDMRRGERSEAWTLLAEAGIITSGLVGSFGAVFGRATAAHPINDGLSEVDASRDLLHGVKVAYGILVQLTWEGRWDEIDDLREVYGSLGLPRSLADLRIDVSDTATIEKIAKAASSPTSSVQLLEPAPSTADLITTMIRLEQHQAGLPAVVLAGTAKN